MSDSQSKQPPADENAPDIPVESEDILTFDDSSLKGEPAPVENGDPATEGSSQTVDGTSDVATDSLQEELQKTQLQAAEFKDKWIRAVADFENYRKRARRDMEKSLNLANANLLRHLLEVLDNFERGMATADQLETTEDGQENAFVQGVRLIQEQLLEIMRVNGLVRIDADQGVFDPNLHEAVTQIPSEDVPSGHIVQVVQEGYLLKDLVLRPARVIVAQ